MMRFAAILLLVLMVFDLGADFVYGESGDLSMPAQQSSSCGQTHADVSMEGTQEVESSSNHECFCCCTHLEQGEPTVIHVFLEYAQEFVPLSSALPDEYLVHIYHPPQHRS
jgi:hypothetical protein